MSLRRALGALCFTALLLYAQSERGSITGLVTDPSGAPMANVPVVIINQATNTEQRISTTNTGDYSADNLEPGAYRIEIEVPGFKRFAAEGVALTAGRAIRVNAALQVGQVNEQVEVQAQTTDLQTENAKVSNAVDNKLVDQLPLVVGGAMRSPFDLVTITPQSKGSGNALSLGGGQAASWGATLDGLTVNTNRSADATETAYVTPSVEAITEFAVDTNGFQAEFGQAGGGVITFASKSGTNAFHGTAYDFLRNDDLDARGFFAAQRSIYKQNDFGVSAGGPVILPKLYNGKNRTFYFLSYEGFRNRLGSNGTIFTVPTAEMYNGNFSNWVNTKGQRLLIYDPTTTASNASGGYTRTPFPNNQIPLSKFSAVSKEILPFAQNVVPNRPGLVPGTAASVSNNYISNSGTTESPTDKGSVKIDQNFGYNHHLAFFYNRTRYNALPGPSGPSGLPEPLYTGQNSDYNSSVYRMSYDWTISPRLVNHFAIGGNKFTKNSYSPNVGQNWKSKVCIPNVVDCNVNFPNLLFSDLSSWGSTAYNGTEQPSWSLKEDLSYVLGKHNFKWGYAFESQRANGFGQQNISGQASFSFLETAVPGATSFTSGSSFASFLLGAADTGATETIRYLPQTFDYHAWYMQDDWHVNSRLTVNLGLRYEFTLPPVAGGNQYSDFSPSTPNPAANNYPGALIFAGYGPGRQNTRSLIPGWYGGWSPRLGFAYTLDPKTTIRAGAGRSFSRVTVVASSSHYAGFIGQYAFSSTNQGITPAFYWDSGLPSYPLPPQINPSFSNNTNVDYWQGNNATRAPEIDFWTFSIERQLGTNTVFEADYNGNAGNHLQAGLVNVNQVPLAEVNQLIGQYGATAAINLLNSNISSSQARAANIPIPYANFTNSSIQRSQSVSQSLRPYPQYLTIDTSQSGGDKSGHSTYHALLLKLNRRFSNGLQFQWSYAFSKILTDSDTYYANSGFAEDEANRRLEKSIGAFDQTHVAKFNTVYELPFGTGKRWLTHGVLNQAFGGWRVTAVQVYASGFPVAVTRNSNLPIFNGVNRPYITSYDWRASYTGSFDPAKDLFFNPGAFPAQPNYLLGNATRNNPLVRAFPTLNENISLGKTFPLTERFHLDFRAEAFNLLNRVVFAAPTASAANINSTSFGTVTAQSNMPRDLQLGLKLYW